MGYSRLTEEVSITQQRCLGSWVAFQGFLCMHVRPTRVRGLKLCRTMHATHSRLLFQAETSSRQLQPHLELCKGVRVVGQAQGVKGAARVQRVGNFSGRATIDTVALG